MHDNIITLRLPEDTVNQLDQLIETFKKEYPGMRINRSDVIRTAILELWQVKCIPNI